MPKDPGFVARMRDPGVGEALDYCHMLAAAEGNFRVCRHSDCRFLSQERNWANDKESLRRMQRSQDHAIALQPLQASLQRGLSLLSSTCKRPAFVWQRHNELILLCRTDCEC
jgi:hypothetical protein